MQSNDKHSPAYYATRWAVRLMVRVALVVVLVALWSHMFGIGLDRYLSWR